MQRRSAFALAVVAMSVAGACGANDSPSEAASSAPSSTVSSPSATKPEGNPALSPVIGKWRSAKPSDDGPATLVVYPDGVVSLSQGDYQCEGKVAAFESAYRFSLDCTLSVKIVEGFKLSSDGQLLTSTKDGSQMKRISAQP